MRVDNTRSRWPNGNEGAVEGGIDDWGEVVTRYPYGNVGMDHLLSKEKRKKGRWKKILFSFECKSSKEEVIEN